MEVWCDRTLDLEVEVGASRKECNTLTVKAAQLQQDNVGLFERIKFLQHYQRDSKASQSQQTDSISSRQQVSFISVQVIKLLYIDCN